jgi:hypothetical protein
MALCGGSISASPYVVRLLGTYQVLPQLDEYPPIFLEYLQGPVRASLVAGLEYVFPLVCVVKLIPLVECCSIAAIMSAFCPLLLAVRAVLTR